MKGTKNYVLFLVSLLSFASTLAQTGDSTTSATSIDDITQSKETASLIEVRHIQNSGPLFFGLISSCSNNTITNQYTSSAGFSSLSSKGFSYSLTQGRANIDSIEQHSPILGPNAINHLVSPLTINTVTLKTSSTAGNTGQGITTSIEIQPNVVQAYQYTGKLSIFQQNGFNSQLGLHNSTMLAYSQTLGSKKIFTIYANAAYTLKREWRNNSVPPYSSGQTAAHLSAIVTAKQYEAVGPNFSQQQKDYYVKVNNWLDFNPWARPALLQIQFPGYVENDLTSKYFQNASANFGTKIKLQKLMLTADYRFAFLNTIYQPYFRYQLKNYGIYQPSLQLASRDFSIRTAGTFENSGASYNLHRTAYHINNNINSAYSNNYASRYLEAYFNRIETLTNGFCINCVTTTQQADSITGIAIPYAAAYAAQTAYPQKGNLAFDTAYSAIIKSSNPASGSAYLVRSKTFFANAEYRFGFQRVLQLALGTTYKLDAIKNNEWQTAGKLFHNQTTYINLDKEFWKNRFLFFASGQFNYTTDFNFRADYRAGLKFEMNGQAVMLSSASGYTMPDLTRRYIWLKDYTAPHYGNSFTQGTWYSYSSVLEASRILVDSSSSANVAALAQAALHTFTVTKLKPQETRVLEIETRNQVARKLYIWTNLYFNWVKNTQALAYVVNPNNDSTTNGITGEQSGANNVLTGIYTPFFTWTNLPVKTNSWGVYVGMRYMAPHGISPYINYHYFGHRTIRANNEAIIAFNDFNTPQHKINLGVSAPYIWRGIGFELNFRWVSAYNWRTDFASGKVPAYHTLDVMIQYELLRAYSTFMVGAQNVYDNRHIEIPGAPAIGAWYYLAWRFDLNLKPKS